MPEKRDADGSWVLFEMSQNLLITWMETVTQPRLNQPTCLPY